jgi:hypothetical protein
MRRDVAVGMTGTAVSIIERQTQQPARTSWFDGMYVGAMTDAGYCTHVRKRRQEPRRE